VERAAGLVLAARFLQLHARADDLHDIGTCDEFVDEVLGDAAQMRAPKKESAQFLLDPRTDRAHVGSAAWVEAPTYLGEFAGGSSAEAERRFIEVDRSGGRYERRNAAQVMD